MTFTTTAGTSASRRLAALHLRRDKDADFTLSCQGTTIAAHSFLLASMSEYFEAALSKDWMEKKERKMEVKDCSVGALNVAVNFMYGISIPGNFTEHGELLHLAELFLMDDLKEVVVEGLAKDLAKANYLEISQVAELYNIDSLINKCANFVFEKMNDRDEINWKEMVKLPKVMAAFGERTMKGKRECASIHPFMTWKVLKKREDFTSDEHYGQFIMQHVENGMVVRMRQDYEGFKVGDLVTLDPHEGTRRSNAGLLKMVEQHMVCLSHRVELLTPSSAVLG